MKAKITDTNADSDGSLKWIVGLTIFKSILSLIKWVNIGLTFKITVKSMPTSIGLNCYRTWKNIMTFNLSELKTIST